ncbi:MAG: ribbon-helix-helix protein, CopG family [Acidobacteria bacterium]|nr:ribbon-helix-helix protein, CopG family [Acidobacteriota bacterium]
MAFTIRTDEELEAALNALSAAEGLSRQEIVRRAVLDRLRQSAHDDLVRESTDRLAKKWAVVLDRLGTE